MCVVSMIFDHYSDKWQPFIQPYDSPPYPPATVPVPIPMPPADPPPITPAEIEEFRRLLERAREYDRRNHEPDCELEEKKQKLREIADQLGIGHLLDFLDTDRAAT